MINTNTSVNKTLKKQKTKVCCLHISKAIGEYHRWWMGERGDSDMVTGLRGFRELIRWRGFQALQSWRVSDIVVKEWGGGVTYYWGGVGWRSDIVTERWEVFNIVIVGSGFGHCD